MKHAIDDYHFLTPRTTKTIKLKAIHDDVDEELDDEELDDGSKRFENGCKVFKFFNNVEYKGSVVGYNPKNKLYQVQYKDGDQEEFYHNEVHAHKEHQLPRDKQWNKTKKK